MFLLFSRHLKFTECTMYVVDAGFQRQGNEQEAAKEKQREYQRCGHGYSHRGEGLVQEFLSSFTLSIGGIIHKSSVKRG